jgi:hypothetical protein
MKPQEMTTTHRELRRLALTVDEPVPGLYFWVVQEEDEEMGIYEPIESAEMPLENYHAALAAGYMALQGLSGPNGPRRGQSEPPSFISPSVERTYETLQ